MNLIDLSLRRPVFAWVIMFAMICFGAICLNRLGISQMPDVDFPILNVQVTYDGAAPEVIESEVIDPIEQKLLGVEGIKEMRSNCQQGNGSVTLEFDIKKNVDVALQEVQSALSSLRLPTNVDPPIIKRQNPEEDPILIISVYGDAPFKEILAWTNDYFLDQLRFVKGVGEVAVGGFSDRNLRVWIDIEKLSKLQLSINDVVEALRTQHLESAAGQFVEGKRELRVRWLGEGVAPAEIGNIRLLRRGGLSIFGRGLRVRDVAVVEDGLSDIRRVARVDGKPAIGITIKKQRGTNEIDVSQAVRAKIDSLKDRFPSGYKYRVNVDFTRSTESTVHLTMEKLLVAGLITILVCFLFLGSIPAAINVLFSIPTSIVGTFMIIYFSGFTINLFTLLALTLSISIVVDDAIMLLENIVRHQRMGKNAVKAASDGAKEVLPAAIAASMAVIAVFLPVIFMDGVIGKFFYQFGVTMSAAVLISLLEAVTITPMRSAAFLGQEAKVSKFEQWLDHRFESIAHFYRRGLAVTLKWKWAVTLGSFAIFFTSLYLVSKVRQEFVPLQDQDIILISTQTPPGSSLEFTDSISKEMEEIIKKDPDVEGFFVSVGAGGPSAQVNMITIPVTLKPKETRTTTHVQIMARLRPQFKKIKGIQVGLRDISARSLSSGRPNPVAFHLSGPDLKVLSEKSKVVMEKLNAEGLTVDLDTDYRTGLPELLVEPRREEMAARGVSVDAVGQILSVAVGGIRQGRYTSNGSRFDLRIKALDSSIKSKEDIERLNVTNYSGNLVPLMSLVNVKEGNASQSITRVNRQRSVAVFGSLGPGQSQSKALDRAREIATEILPVGYTFGLEGASAGFADSFKSLSSALWIGILVAYLILAVQFNSFLHPIAVLVALPFSLTGALIALWYFGASLNLFSFIGLIVLMGISKKNSIMLVEFANQVRAGRDVAGGHAGAVSDKPMSKKNSVVVEALLAACPVRLRPIIMTSFATVAAALPLVLGSSMGSEARLPMGLAIIGGTIVSTILTLYVVPALYLILSSMESQPLASREALLRGEDPGNLLLSRPQTHG